MHEFPPQSLPQAKASGLGQQSPDAPLDTHITVGHHPATMREIKDSFSVTRATTKSAARHEHKFLSAIQRAAAVAALAASLLQAQGQEAPPAPSITIDAAKVGAPLSPNVYSQFIEHLGRCIYGGIWAEMLEDRKFYYPVTADYKPYRSLRESAFPVVGASPWQIIGEAGSVVMSTNKPFVGRHTPVVKAGSGIRQHDLGVTQGKEYVGYAWLKSAGPGSPEVEVALTAGEGQQPQVVRLERVDADYKKFPFKFKAGATTDKATFELRVGKGDVAVGTVSLMPGDNVDGMRADTLALLKELRAPIYRWPGGNFCQRL